MRASLPRKSAGGMVLGLGLLAWGALAQNSNVITTAAAVRALTAEQAARGLPVQLQGVVTFVDDRLFSRFLQDGTAGIYLDVSSNFDNPAHFVKVGQMLAVAGVTGAGEFAPVVLPTRVQILGTTNLPTARPVTFEQLASGQEDSQLVEVNGIVRSTELDPVTDCQQIEVALGGSRITAYVRGMAAQRAGNLIGSLVRIRGICATRFNHQRQLFHISIFVPQPDDFVVVKSAPGNPFAIDRQSIGSLLRFTPAGTYGHLVKVAGTVTYQQPGSSLFVENEGHGLMVQTRQPSPLQLGDEIEVVGFPAEGEYTPLLEDAFFRRVRSGPSVKPTRINADDALKGAYDCRLVCLEASLVGQAQLNNEQLLVLAAGQSIFNAYYHPPSATQAIAKLENGSRVQVTGIGLVSLGSGWAPGEVWRAKSFHLLLRSPADVAVLQTPPWWTFKKLLWMVGFLTLIILAAFAWVGFLRRRVHKQTEIIRQKLVLEESLKERYEDLFENASDIVFTLDQAGRVSSINRTGERLLECGREQILQRRFVELIAPEQQAAAEQWLGQVLKNATTPTAEWDFIVPQGQPLKLEISTRLIDHQGRQIEIEGNGRDITERKRLEREILEISNREQRRIGHDLHDGICQQLVGISYLTETVAEELEKQGAPESEEVERIRRLLGTAIGQTRGIARGLFPVRLAENGLASALEEMVANSGQLFQVTCHFACEAPPGDIDNAVALHVYYIAMEAVANAAKHSQAGEILVALKPVGRQHELTIRDQGKGFSPKDVFKQGMGMRIMQYRARFIGATLEIHSAPGQGTTVTCRFRPAVPDFSPQAKG